MDEEAVKKAQTLEARARSICQNVRCTECGSQSIEDSQADIAILLRKFMIVGAAAGMWAYQKHRHKNNVHIMALNLLRGVALTLRERETMLDILDTPSTPEKEVGILTCDAQSLVNWFRWSC
ncbi:cytochrome c-type biogenesis CcmH-like mitochondrial protein isoform X2 [Cinnamomum micranthum f. kanehirae]|uniref:Cytochrome c-type biogenesis protein n=1 Tax=Cinnamomum micranthum f. kanehirae TaxID=337451 RepID=A0A3S4PHS5_9MAGN|nr:cytochrome c-type biogenesis CcmH-like mitochondrial protein isoform X2 [Cinnamomum micranthum f. kanehirae]